MWKRIGAFLLTAALLFSGICWPAGQDVPKSARAVETYMVYFDSQGGSQVDPVTGLTSGSYISNLPIPVWDGYIFDGWYTDTNYTNRFTSYTSVTNNMVLFAKWREKTIVTLKASYATTAAVIGSLLDKEKITVVATYIDNTTKTLESKDFDIVDSKVANAGTNYFTVRAGSGGITASFTVLGIQEITYTVAFYSNGGSAVSPIAGIKENGTISMPAEPYWSGYEFQGWYLDNNTFKEPFNSDYKITKNLIVFAKWEKLEVIVETPVYKLNATDLSLKVNEQKSLFIKSYDPYLEMSYFSDDNNVATVTTGGIVEGKKPGFATIYVVTPEGSMLECQVAVSGSILAKSIKLNATSKSLKVKKTFQIKTTFSPSTVSSKKLSYSSSNKKIAKVSSSGKVTALKKGTCYISVKTKDGSKLTKKIKIKVY